MDRVRPHRSFTCSIDRGDRKAVAKALDEILDDVPFEVAGFGSDPGFSGKALSA
jgi:hypothetical protein